MFEECVLLALKKLLFTLVGLRSATASSSSSSSSDAGRCTLQMNEILPVNELLLFKSPYTSTMLSTLRCKAIRSLPLIANRPIVTPFEHAVNIKFALLLTKFTLHPTSFHTLLLQSAFLSSTTAVTSCTLPQLSSTYGLLRTSKCTAFKSNTEIVMMVMLSGNRILSGSTPRK